MIFAGCPNILLHSLQASSVLVLQILHCLEAGLESYTHMTEGANPTNAQFLAQVGMDMNSLLESANANLGGLIIAEYVSSLFSTVYGIFFSTTLMSVFYQVLVLENSRTFLSIFKDFHKEF